MGVFEGERPTEVNQALLWAATHLVARAVDLGLFPADDMRWSTAQLRLSEEDYEWLYACVRGCDGQASFGLPRTMELAGQRVSRSEAAGLVLLVLIAEWARREGSEGELWPEVKLLDCWVRLGFLFEGQRETLNRYLRAAADRFGLRQCHRTSGSYHIVDTVFLQFGFTRRGCFERLGDWISGGGTYAMKELLERGDDPANASGSFRSLVRALRLYKRGRWPQRMLRDVLDASAWVLPEWREPLVEALGRTDALADDPGLDELPVRQLLGEPRLKWTGRDPHVELAIETDRRWPAGYQADRYWLWLAGRRQLELRRSGDGYQPWPRQAFVRLPCDGLPTTLNAWVGDSSGQGIESFGPWTLYDASSEINLWSERGRPIGARDPLDANQGYTLLLPPDYAVMPQPEGWSRTSIGCFHRLPVSWSPDTQVLDAAGQLVWRPATGERRRWPEWLDGVSAEVVGPVTFGDVPQVRVQVQAGTGIEWVQVDREPKVVPVDRPVTAVVRGSEILAAPGGGSIVVNVGVWREGSERCRALRVPLPLDADVLVRPGGEGEPDAWEVLRPDSAIRHTGHPPKLAFFRPRREGGHELWAGSKFLGWVDILAGRSTLSMPEWSPGLGEELAMWRGGAKVRVLGMVTTARPFAPGMVDGDVLVLPRDFPPGPDHQVACWCRDGRVELLEPVLGLVPWLVELPERTLPRAVALTWRREWQDDSTWCDEHWCDGLDELGPEAVVVAGWFRLPVLAEPALVTLRAIAQNHGPQVLRCWLGAQGLPPGVAPPPEDVGAVLGSELGLRPEELGWGLSDLVAMLDGLSPGPVLHRLLGWDAAWTTGLLREWVVEHALANLGLPSTGEILDELVFASGENVPDDLRRLAEEVAGVRQEQERWRKSMQLP